MKFGKAKKNDGNITTDNESVNLEKGVSALTEKKKKKFNIKNLKQIFKEKKSRRICIAVIVVIIILSSFMGWYIHGKNIDAKSKAVTAKVTRGDISNVIEGTGTIEAISQYEITSLAKGDVVADYFEEGDYVEKDQLLYKIDSSSVDKNIQKQQSSIEKAQMNYSDAAENVSDLNVKSTVSGVVTNMYVSVGDNVSNGAKIADVVDRNNLILTIPFGAEDARHIYVGESATVTLANSFTTMYGTVKSIGTGSYVNSYGVNVTDVEIKVTNPGTVSSGEKATAMIGSYACYDSGEIKYANSKTITSKVAGEVTKISKKKGDSVNSGGTIVTLSSSSVQKSIKEAQMSLNDANLSLDDLYDNLDDYSIKAPIKGKVIQKNIKAGEKLDSNSSSTMAIIADLSTLTFDISIDELDISSISVGQEVSIEADAIEGKTFTGKVNKISIVGEAYQGVTSYPVTVTIDNSEETKLIPGMNVSAKIEVESVENVLKIPVSAVRMGNFVIVKDDGTFTDVEDTIKKREESKKSDMSNNSKADETQKTDESGQIEQNQQEQQNQQKNQQEQQNKQTDNPNGKFQAPHDFQGTPPQRGTGQGDSQEKSSGKSVSSLFGTMKVYAADDENSRQDRTQNMLKSLDVPDGYTVVMIETGLSDGSFIEVKETDGGLKEGDVILLPDTTSTSSKSNQQMQGGMMGGMGMPGGGAMPSSGVMPGGMNGGNRQSNGMNSNSQSSNGQNSGTNSNRQSSGASSSQSGQKQ